MDERSGQIPGRSPVRRYPRMSAEYVVAYRRAAADDGGSATQFSRTLTLGLGGLMFESETPLVLGEALQLEIVLGEKTIKTTGVVIHIDHKGGGPWRSGVQFTEISEDDRDALLSAYLQQEYHIDPA